MVAKEDKPLLLGLGNFSGGEGLNFRGGNLKHKILVGLCDKVVLKGQGWLVAPA